MSQTPYLLPFFSDGGGATVPVEGSSQAILFSLLGSQVAQDGYTRTTFTLLPDRASGGFLVNHEKTILGRLPRNLRDTYPQLDHIITRGGIPEVHATISLAQGSGRISGNLYFPAPVFVMPTNFPPKEEWAMIPEGTPRPVDISRGDAQRLVDLNIPSHWLATLGIVDDLIVSVIDNHVLGVLSPEDSQDVRLLVEHYEMLGLTPVARVFCYDKDGERHVVLNALSAQDMTDEELEPTVSPLPPIDPYQPATGEFPVISDVPMEHAWAVTISGEQVMEAFAPRPNKELRPITSPAMFALNPDGTKVLEAGRRQPTAEDSLPEVQRVPNAPAPPGAEPLPDFAPAEETEAEEPQPEVEVVPLAAAEAEDPGQAEIAEAEDPGQDYYPPLPYPHARLGDQFQEDPENGDLEDLPEPTSEPVEGIEDSLPEIQKVPAATALSADAESTGTLPVVPDPHEDAPEDSPPDGEYEDYGDDYAEEQGIQWLPAIGVILGALSITVAALGYFKVTPDLSLDTAPAFILLGGGMLLVLGSLWFMFRSQD